VRRLTKFGACWCARVPPPPRGEEATDGTLCTGLALRRREEEREKEPKTDNIASAHNLIPPSDSITSRVQTKETPPEQLSHLLDKMEYSSYLAQTPFDTMNETPGPTAYVGASATPATPSAGSGTFYGDFGGYGAAAAAAAARYSVAAVAAASTGLHRPYPNPSPTLPSTSGSSSGLSSAVINTANSHCRQTPDPRPAAVFSMNLNGKNSKQCFCVKG